MCSLALLFSAHCNYRGCGVRLFCCSQGVYVWADGTGLISETFVKWAPGQPNNWFGQHCAELNTRYDSTPIVADGEWSDYNCVTDSLSYVCEIRTFLISESLERVPCEKCDDKMYSMGLVVFAMVSKSLIQRLKRFVFNWIQCGLCSSFSYCTFGAAHTFHS